MAVSGGAEVGRSQGDADKLMGQGRVMGTNPEGGAIEGLVRFDFFC